MRRAMAGLYRSRNRGQTTFFIARNAALRPLEKVVCPRFHFFATKNRRDARSAPVGTQRLAVEWQGPLRGGKGSRMADRQGAGRPTAAAGAGDFIVLGARALVSGVAVALALGFAAVVLAQNAQAAAVKVNDARNGELLLQTGTPGEYTLAPTVETEVAIRVTGMIARTRLTQSFHNPGAEWVEGIYVFPLPENAAVDHLAMRIGEREIEGRIEEKAEARKAYEKAKSEGRKAALVEQQRPNLFTNSVAHIGPNEMVRVTIEYQQALSPEGGRYRLRFPL